MALNDITHEQRDELNESILPQIQRLFEESSFDMEDMEDITLKVENGIVLGICFPVGGQIICIP